MDEMNLDYDPELLSDSLIWGIERESLRLDPCGNLARSPHPATLSRPFFDRDFAESQLEIITSPRKNVALLHQELQVLTEKARQEIGDETLWPHSMPPDWEQDQDVRLAMTEGEGRLYRQGLALRYGLRRQLISGIHINVSLSGALLDLLAETGSREQIYIRLLRYLYSRLPLMTVLFGGSPFMAGQTDRVFSWRNSPGGYGGIHYRPFLDTGDLNGYVRGIERGLRRESTVFSRNGLWGSDGRTQINNRIFQSEKEFYAPIRIRGENGLATLKKGHISRLEIRVPDLDPYESAGISLNALRLMELITLYGLINREIVNDSDIQDSFQLTDTLSLADPFNIVLPEKLKKQYSELVNVAKVLDSANGSTIYSDVHRYYNSQLYDTQLTLSGRLIFDNFESDRICDPDSQNEVSCKGGSNAVAV